MNATQLAEIGNWAAFNAPQLICGPTSLTAATCNEYWLQSKCRQNRWMTALKMFEQDLRNPQPGHDPWPAIEIVIQEILLSELLTRIWSASMLAHDVWHKTNELGNIAHSIHIGHVESRNRAMRLLLDDESVCPATFDRLNSLRRKVERWTDLLLAQCPDIESAYVFAFQSKRVADFREESVDCGEQMQSGRRALYAAAMAEDFNRLTVQYSANPEINRRIASGLMACFPGDRFDSHGLPKSIQMFWLERTTDVTQSLIDDLAALDNHL